MTVVALWLLGCPKGGPAAATPAPPTVWAWAPASSSPHPELLGSLMSQFYDLHLLLAVARAGDELTITIASSADGATQDPCAPTTTVGPIAVDGAGSFHATAERIGFAANGLYATARSVELAGTAGDGALALAQVAAVIDTREYLALLGSGPDDTLCSMMPAMGACAECPSGGALCWPVSFSGGAPARVETPVVARSKDEVCANAACTALPVCAGG